MLSTVFKNTLLFLSVSLLTCGKTSERNQVAGSQTGDGKITDLPISDPIITGAENTDAYFPLLKDKKIGIVTNQTGIVTHVKTATKSGKSEWRAEAQNRSVVDFFLDKKIDVRKIYAPEHGFRGTADAGELIIDGKDSKTGIPIISLYGDNKKPKEEHLAGIDVMVFDLQDVGARFYTYISTLHYLMEACAENGIPLLIFDRPNPNGNIVDGPILEKEFTSFVGMHPVPILHGMTIGEYGKMINGQKWLKNGIQCDLTVIPCLNYNRTMTYVLPVKPSPNLPNAKSINLYASLCLFEGTNVSVGRGTNKQFQIYGSPFLHNNGFSFIPKPNEGAKDPLYNGKTCFGEDLSDSPEVKRLELKWIISAYSETVDKSKFFIPFFEKLAGTRTLRQQIENGVNESEIRQSWATGIYDFKKIRKLYEMY